MKFFYSVVLFLFFAGANAHAHQVSDSVALRVEVTQGDTDKGVAQPKPLLNLRLSSAAIHGDTDKVVTLINAGADANAQDKSGRTALMETTFNGQTHTAKVLIDAGADLNVQDRSGSTALMWATRRGHIKT